MNGSAEPERELAVRLQKPIFLVGTVRSGTTLVAEYLNAHPLIQLVGFELADKWSRFGNTPMAVVGNDDADCPAMRADQATKVARRSLEKKFAKMFKKRGGREGQHFLNKNPHLSNKLPYLRRLFPDARLVVTSRPLHATVASTKRLWKHISVAHGVIHYLPQDADSCWSCIPKASMSELDPGRCFPGGDIRVLAEYWLRTYELIDLSMDSFDRVALVRHRDLVEAPVQVLDQALSALEIAPTRIELPQTIDGSRNEFWQRSLLPNEQRALASFVEINRNRILALKSADIML